MRARFAVAVLPGLGLMLAACSHGDCDDYLGSRPTVTNFAVPCKPSAFHPGRDGGFSCCSDDPAASQGRLPAYAVIPPADGLELGEPLFADLRNDLSAFGQCALGEVEAADVFDDCLVPCNPRWSHEDVVAVCGGGNPFMSCCQTVPTEPADCLNVDGLWRAVRGSDMSSPEDWVTSEPGTRQDPELAGCHDWAMVEERFDATRFRDCVSQLGSADQRGLCIPVETCPVSEEIDPCLARNG